jgi:hypothetical protein
MRSAVPGLLEAVSPQGSDPDSAAIRLLADSGPGLLDGAAGIALAVLRPAGSLDLRSRWDECLLIT